MFEIGDEVYFESRDETGKHVYNQGFGIITETTPDRKMYRITTSKGTSSEVVHTGHDRYKHDIIRKLTKLDKALK